MKQCSKCGQTYADDSLFYCLSDGTLLSGSDSTLDETVIRSSPFVPQTTQPQKRGVSPLFAYSLIALLALIIGGGIVFWLRTGREVSSPSQARAENSPLPPNSSPEKTVDIQGKWTGTFSNRPATLVFRRDDGNKYSGTLIRAPFEIAVDAYVDLAAKQVLFEEKSVIKGKGWGVLGTSKGSISMDGKSMTGRGQDEHGKSYSWSFSKN